METPIQNEETRYAASRSMASVLHEINNPLESLLNLLYLAEADPAISEISRGYLKMAQAEVVRVAKIAHAGMKRFPTDGPAQHTDVAALLASVLELHKPKLDRHKVSASTRNCPDATALVYPERMRQVFSNLLLNAVDAMPAGGKVYAKISKTQEWGGQERPGLRITVADTGTGIPADILSRICEPFFTTKGVKGNGMGLAVVQEIVTQHGGRIKVRSNTNSGKSGSVFSIFIPSEARA